MNELQTLFVSGALGTFAIIGLSVWWTERQRVTLERVLDEVEFCQDRVTARLDSLARAGEPPIPTALQDWDADFERLTGKPPLTG